jgi:hypothetical protein
MVENITRLIKIHPPNVKTVGYENIDYDCRYKILEHSLLPYFLFLLPYLLFQKWKTYPPLNNKPAQRFKLLPLPPWGIEGASLTTL